MIKISNLKICKKAVSVCKNNVILQVFTREYNRETEYNEMIKNNIDRLKLKSNNYDIDEKVKVLKKNNYQSNFKIESINNIK